MSFSTPPEYISSTTTLHSFFKNQLNREKSNNHNATFCIICQNKFSYLLEFIPKFSRTSQFFGFV